MIILSVYRSLFSRILSICFSCNFLFSSFSPSFPFLFSPPLSFLVKRDNLTCIFSSSTDQGGLAWKTSYSALFFLTKFIFHSILTHKLPFTPFQNFVISFPSHTSAHSSPRQRPLRAPRAAFGQRLEAGNLQDLAPCVVAMARIG